MDELDMVAEATEEVTPKKPKFESFDVRVDTSRLNIRTSPKYADDNKTGKYTGKGVFKIVRVRNGWGKLESGEGWINLDFVTKI